MSNFTEMDCYLFGQATHYDIYRKMGAHKMTIEGEEGVCFDVWAPHADRVYVIGEFNGWNETSHEMKRVTPETMGVYELFVPGVQIGCMYKFLIIAQDGRKLYKADPYAKYAQLRPENASIVKDISNFLWTQTINGKMPHGSRTVRNLMKKNSRWRSMRYIRVPGCAIRGGTMMDFIPTAIWQRH